MHKDCLYVVVGHHLEHPFVPVNFLVNTGKLEAGIPSYRPAQGTNRKNCGQPLLESPMRAGLRSQAKRG